MINTEVLIVGGGPAGSACAWRLHQQGIDCLMLDQHPFPRLKPCAGWITPEVLIDLHLASSEYPLGLTTFRSFRIWIGRFGFRIRTCQHAIRRVEFDHWLLQRSGTPVHLHTVKAITQTSEGYTIDDTFSGKYLVGAGGTACPVQRALFQGGAPRDQQKLVVAMEEEFPYTWSDGECRLWFLQDHLPGYAWYVPKADNYVNVGVGGTAEVLKKNRDSLKHHWQLLVEKLEWEGLVKGHSFKPSGHSYYVRQKRPTVQRGNALIIGDSVGLATRDMGEGIGPAIRSGLLAAEAIVAGTEYSISTISQFSFGSILRSGFLQG